MVRDLEVACILSPEERQRLLSLGAEFDHDVKGALVIVPWQTFKRMDRTLLLRASFLVPAHLQIQSFVGFIRQVKRFHVLLEYPLDRILDLSASIERWVFVV